MICRTEELPIMRSMQCKTLTLAGYSGQAILLPKGMPQQLADDLHPCRRQINML